MRKTFSEKIERARLDGPAGETYGVFRVLCPKTKEWLAIIASDGTEEIPWDHVSVSTRTRVPTWDEMCWVKDQFFEPEECVVQYHPPASTYVNIHPFCLHLWRPHRLFIPVPPLTAV